MSSRAAEQLQGENMGLSAKRRKAMEERISELSLTIPSQLAAIEPVCEQIRGLLTRCHLEELEFAVEIVARECLNNAILHGNQGMADARVSFGMGVGRKRIWLRVTDEGPGFDWRRSRRNGLPAETAVAGRGLMVTEFYAHRIAFNQRGNQVTLWINRTKEGR